MSNETIKPTRGVIYGRSANEPASGPDGATVEQTEVCKRYASEAGIEVIEEFWDHANGAQAARPGMQALLTFLDAQPKGAPVAVLVDEPARIARDVSVFQELRHAIEERGGVLAFAQPQAGRWELSRPIPNWH